jgi:hypothetical protein
VRSDGPGYASGTASGAYWPQVIRRIAMEGRDQLVGLHLRPDDAGVCEESRCRTLRDLSAPAHQLHSTRTYNVRVPPSMTPQVSPRSANGARLPIDHTRWMAVVIEIVSIAGAVVFAYLHAAA